MNTEQLFSELEESFKQKQDTFFRIGTGEFTDSLAIDRLTALSSKLVRYMSHKKNGVLELKTKSGVIANLENLDHKGRTIVAWSLNSTSVMAKQEIRSATFEERIQAAQQCAAWGYKLAFHFDPIIEHPHWQEEYTETITRLFEVVPADAIAWISLGALRFLPSLKDIGIQRFPATRIYFNEFIQGLDGKNRYFRPERVNMYKVIYSLLKERTVDKTCVYFCMESDEIWQEVMGFAPHEKGGLPKMLDASVR